MESGVQKKFISLYWVTWTALLIAPVISAWGSQQSIEEPKSPNEPNRIFKKFKGEETCQDQLCSYQTARDHLVFQFLYHSKNAQSIQNLSDEKKILSELEGFCAGLKDDKGAIDARNCQAFYLRTMKGKLDETRAEILRMETVIERLKVGDLNVPTAPAVDANGRPLPLKPRTLQPMDLTEFSQQLALQPVVSDAEAKMRYAQWVASQPGKPFPHHFPRVKPQTVTDPDGSQRVVHLIDRSCPTHPGSECYDMQAYQAALQKFEGIQTPTDAFAKNKVSSAPLTDAQTSAYQYVQGQTVSAVHERERMLLGYDKATDPGGAVRAIASQPRAATARKKASEAPGFTLQMDDQKMRSEIEKIQF